ncbi:MAG: PP2C family protein-serine/threonine phosphatase [Bacteroidales bacterium]|jgi:sigma-B regulation protein RsbU (phosphoserine phosphatase)|nr:PP2C family protein-serine/threonine phosphatase [Bacteroidales bacterium]
MPRKSSGKRLEMSRFKLDSLLDITQSINANLPAEELLKKYETILRDELSIGKIFILFREGNKWNCLLNAGYPDKMEEKIDPSSQLADIKETKRVSVADELAIPNVDIIFPVFNNNEPLSYIFIGDIEEEAEGMSPVLKHLHFIQTITNIIIVAIENIKLFHRSLRQEAIRKELELAARMQTMLIPDNKSLPQNDKIFVSGYYHPHFQIGGDYYDCIRLSDNITGLCIADVSGKGISAALLMSNFQATLRALFTFDTDLEKLIRKLNEVVVTNASGEKFITFFVARYNHETKELQYINAAHNAPLLYDTSDGSIKYLRAKTVGIGMLDRMPSVEICTIKIKNPSKIFCYTDGLSEIKDDSGRDIGTKPIEKHIANTDTVDKNINALIKELGIPDDNPNLFDDVSLIAANIY